MEGYLDGVIFKPGRGAVYVRACSFLPIWHDLRVEVIIQYTTSQTWVEGLLISSKFNGN